MGRGGVTAEVPPGCSGAQVPAERGVVIPISCKQGVCGTGVTRARKDIVDHSDRFLTVCCSRVMPSNVLMLGV